MKGPSRFETILWWLQSLAPAAVIATPLFLVIVHSFHPPTGAAHVERATQFIKGAEQRSPNGRPQFPRSVGDWTALPENTTAWVNDLTPLRAPLVTLHNRLKFALGVAPNASVILGRDGWLFYGERAERDDVRRISRLSRAEKERWLVYLNRLHDEALRHSAAFLLVIAPDKSSVYPEFLPVSLRARTTGRRIDDLLEYLRAHGCRAAVLDLRADLRAAKSADDLYFRTDTHWNERGAVVAADAIRKTLESADTLPPRPPLRRNFITSERTGGDLRFPGGDARKETAPRLRPRPRFEKNPGGAARDAFAAFFPLATSRQFTTSAAAAPSLLMLHDSFGLGLIPPLSAEFSRAAYVFVGPATPTIDQFAAALAEFRPGVVILERVERYFAEPPEV